MIGLSESWYGTPVTAAALPQGVSNLKFATRTGVT
jgi:hypothetical protein